MRRKLAAAVVLAVAGALLTVPVAAPADEPPIDGHVHGDLEEFSGVHLHGSDAQTARPSWSGV